MRKLIKISAVLLCFTLYFSSNASAARQVIQLKGSAETIEFDPRTIPVEIQPGFLALKTYCLDCHSQERIIKTLITGKSPVTNHLYGENDFKDKIIKILRGSKTELDRNAAKELHHFFSYIINKAIIKG